VPPTEENGQSVRPSVPGFEERLPECGTGSHPSVSVLFPRKKPLANRSRGHVRTETDGIWFLDIGASAYSIRDDLRDPGEKRRVRVVGPKGIYTYVRTSLILLQARLVAKSKYSDDTVPFPEGHSDSFPGNRNIGIHTSPEKKSTEPRETPFGAGMTTYSSWYSDIHLIIQHSQWTPLARY
jgi:hypothetical protein